MANEDVQVTFGANTSALTAATAQVKEELNGLNAVTAQLSSAFGSLGNATALLGGLLVTLGLDHFVRGMADSGVQAERLSAALGITGHQFLDLKAAAALSGTEIGTLALSIERMSLNIQRSTRDAFSPQAEALKVLGLQAKDLIGLSADQYFNKLTEAASKFNPSLNLTNALMAIGGRSMANMVAAFTRGSEEVKQFTEEMARTKIGQEGFYAAAATTHRELLLMDSAVEGLNKQLFVALKPTLDIIIKQTREFAIEMREAVKPGGDWSFAMDALVVSLKGVVQIINLTSAAILGFAVIAKEAWKFVLDGQYSFDKLRERAGELAYVLENIGTSQLLKFKELWQSTSEELKKRPLGLDAPAMNEQGRKALEVLQSQIESMIKLRDLAYDRQTLLYDRDLNNLKITEAEKVKLVGAASQQRYADEVALLQQKLQLGGIDIAQRAQIEHQISEMVQRAANERLKIEIDYSKAVEKEWSFMESALTSSFSTALRGLLAGTTSWKEAMRSIFADVVTAAINEFVRLNIIKPLIASLADAFSPVTFISNILQVITKLIGQVFSGATAFFAPTLGPAAIPAGMAVATATETAALGFEQGAWSVPQTAHALVHRDEMILPVDFASAVRSALTGGAFGGSSNLTVSIQAWDGASVQRWLRTGGADLLSRAISATYNQNPTIRPRY